MPRRITIINGHPDASDRHFVHALAQAYGAGAADAGHESRTIAVGALEFPWLRTNEDFQEGRPPEAIRTCQDAIAWADHLVIVFPLWLGSMPAVLKAFLEQALRPGFAFGSLGGRGLPKKLLTGKSAHVVVTMGMPAFFFRWYYRAHGLRSLERNVLAFCGIDPVRSTVVGMVHAMSDAKRKSWLARMREFGRRAK